MGPPQKSYLPAPNSDLPPPPTGPIVLGSIIADPSKPARSLNKKNIPTPPNVLTNIKKDTTVTSGQVRSRGGGIFTTFLATAVGLGIDLGGKTNSDNKYTIKSAIIETQFFYPDDEYLFTSLQNENVRKFGKMAFWVKDVYMVTGVKIARGVTMIDSTDKDGWEVAAAVKVDGTPSGTPVGVKSGVKMEGTNKLGVKVGDSDDFVFGYSLVRIKRKKDGAFTDVDYNKGALYDTDKPEEEVETVDKLHEQWTFEEGIEGAIPDDD